MSPRWGPWYYLRLDDACPTWDRDRWMRVLELVLNRGWRPLIAVVPQNADPDLKRAPPDPSFFDTLRALAALGCPLGLHGFEHRLRPRVKGLVPRNAYGEWAGEELAVQRERMRRAWAATVEQGWRPEWWVAPAHNMDLATIQALTQETPIRQVSDGWSLRPYRRYGVLWLPQQLGAPRHLPFGFWTVALHPNIMDRMDLKRLASWLHSRPTPGRWEDLPACAGPWHPGDGLFSLGWRVARASARLLRGRGG